jgi:hypothetical protein
MTQRIALLFLALLISGQGQVSPMASGSAVDQQKLKDAASKGFRLEGASIGPQVHIEAVLLPAAICRHVFGKEIAENYVAIELTVSNKNHDAAFLIHSVLIDYEDWLMSGSPQALARYAATVSGGPIEPDARRRRTEAFQASTLENQVASVEYRVVRGEALDAQQWSSRNWTMRALQLAGVLATGSEFAFKEQGIIKAIGAFTGQGIPAANVFWPDGTVPQLDRISDFGFRTNKVIPKESADIVVAFFPIDRFIAPSLKKIFLKSPAVFFTPGSIFTDPKVDPQLRRILNNLLENPEDAPLNLQKTLAQAKGRAILEGISLNNVRVSVGGIMVVDADTIPARIDSISFDGTPDWSKAGKITGAIHGSLLSGAQPAVMEDLKLNPQPVADNSTDTELHFTLSVPEGGVPDCTALHFHVTKSKDSKTTDSNHVQVTVPGAHCDGGK